MYTSVLCFALAAVPSAAELIPVAPAWRSDYSIALKEGRKSKRPLAIFVGSGPEGWDKISQEGGLDKEAKDLLQRRYVCLYLDSRDEESRSLIAKLELSNRTGLIIGDASGEAQAFRHEGTLHNEDINRYLRKYSDPDVVVVRTERVAETRPTYRTEAPIASPPPYYYGPSMSFGGCKT